MNCPLDGTTLAIAERRGIEIDYCPECRGVWLDRGELDKLLDRAAEEFPEPQPEPRHDPRPEPRYEPRYEPRPEPRYEHRGYGDPKYRKKKKSFLSEFLDFD